MLIINNKITINSISWNLFTVNDKAAYMHPELSIAIYYDEVIDKYVVQRDGIRLAEHKLASICLKAGTSAILEGYADKFVPMWI